MREFEGKTYLTTGEAARRLGVSARTLLRWTEKPLRVMEELQWFKDPANDRIRYFEEDSVEQLRLALRGSAAGSSEEGEGTTTGAAEGSSGEESPGQEPESAAREAGRPRLLSKMWPFSSKSGGRASGPLPDRSERGDVVILHPRANLIGGEETDAFRASILDEISGGASKLILNLADTPYLNSLGLAIIFQAHVLSARVGGELKICCLSDRVRNAFIMTKLGMVLSVHETEEEALEAFGVNIDNG